MSTTSGTDSAGSGTGCATSRHPDRGATDRAGSDGLDAANRATGASSRIYTVPPGQPFLRVFASALLNGDLPQIGGVRPSPITLPGITILLPTSRAARALQEAFLAAGNGRAMLLPKIRPIAEGQEDLNLLSGLANLSALAGTAGGGTTGAAGIDDIAPAVSELERRLVLTQLVLAWSKTQSIPAPGDEQAKGGSRATPAQAAGLAAELASLIDAVETENVSLDGLQKLVPDNFSAHWQQTLDFLRIVTEFWPAHLAERGVASAAGRRNRLILGEAARLAANPPAGPVIVAGVTGSIPATAELMKVVAGLPLGAIVLPGLDQIIDEDGWRAVAGEAADDGTGNNDEAGNHDGASANGRANINAATQAGPGAGQPRGHPEHPQFRLKKLLDLLCVARSDVRPLPGCELSAQSRARQSLVSQAMRPAATTSHWHDFAASADKDEVRGGFAGVDLLELPGSQDEAEAIALIMREALETPGKTAALVSPDRLLARRVAIRLDAWGIRVDDSAGRPFAKTVPGAFLNLVIEAIANHFAPAPLMSLLRHPLTRLAMPAAMVRRAGRALELAAFRAPYLGRGLAGVEAALERAKEQVDGGRRRGRAVNRLWDDDWTAARDLVMALQGAFAPLIKLFDDGHAAPLSAFARAHVETAEALSRRACNGAGKGEGEETERGEAGQRGKTAERDEHKTGQSDEESALWQGEAGEAAALLLAGLMDEDMPAPDLLAPDYPDFYRALISGQNVLSKIPVHPRLSIWGLFEARLQQADVMIIGALNEGTWPKTADPGPWLNRPMRRDLGLPSPEEAIGTMAHDFSSLLGARQVYLTRAAKVDGVPTVPSRWLMRLQALLGGMGLADALGSDRPWTQWARHRDAIEERIELKAPQPCPPLALRPRALSVTAIETWIANPYAIFAGRILKLDPLPALGGEPDAALRGSVIHEALSRFTQRYGDHLPADVAGALIEIADEILADYKAHPRVAAFWLPRFRRFADWFADKEPQWREGFARRLVEVDGSLVLEAPAGPFTLKARADRIDFGAAGLIITDYKTGQVPTGRRVLSGAAPQLPLEAAIAEADGFAGLSPPQTGKLAQASKAAKATSVTGLRYVRATGGEPPGKAQMVQCDDISALAATALQGLQRLVADFDKLETPYRAVRRGAFDYRYDDYAHLARVAEWSGRDDEEGAP